MTRHSKQTPKFSKVSQKNNLVSFQHALDRLEGILRFLQSQTYPQSPTEIQDLSQEFGEYLNGILLESDGGDHEEAHLVDLKNPNSTDDYPMASEDNKKSIEEKIALIRIRLQKVLEEFLFPSDPLVVCEIRTQIMQQRILEGDTLEERLIATDISEGLKFRLLEDLAIAGSALKICPAEECGRFFVRRYRQSFCSASCRNRTNFRKWYGKKKKQKDISQSTKKITSSRKQEKGKGK